MEFRKLISEVKKLSSDDHVKAITQQVWATCPIEEIFIRGDNDPSRHIGIAKWLAAQEGRELYDVYISNLPFDRALMLELRRLKKKKRQMKHIYSGIRGKK